MSRARLVSLCWGCVVSIGCGSAPPPTVKPASTAASATPSAAAPASAAPAAAPPPASASAATAPEPRETPGFSETLALLRPAGTETALAELSAAPSGAESYAKAALAFAPTDAPAMTLIWAMTYQAMGGGKSDGAVAQALSVVLRERVRTVHNEQTQRDELNVRLAPGQMPARQEPDGSVHAPIAHVFETSFSPAFTGLKPPWTIQQFYDALSSWVGEVASHGTPLDERLELDAWLVVLARAGHLEAYCHALLGPAFPAELKQYRAKSGVALRAYQSYLKGSALHPKQAPMPDELVRIQ